MEGTGPLAWMMKRLHGPVYAARLRELVREIVPHLKADDRVLDVGCGNGLLGAALRDAPAAPAGLVVHGLERVARGGEAIDVTAYNGKTIPFADDAYDVVILADVLHHEPEPDRLLAECRRVCGRLLIIKDHQIAGPLARARICLIDWAANAPHGVPCLYRYNTPTQWTDSHRRHELNVVAERRTMPLYPAGYNLLFGRRLQYFAVLAKPPAGAAAL